jgi:sporulation protein YlmC with PRC-barrel domain
MGRERDTASIHPGSIVTRREIHMDRQRTTTTTGSYTTTRRTLSAGSLIGDKVVNPQGDTLGSLKEIMLDVDEGRIAYGVLESGGFLGMGAKLFAIPFEAFRIDQEHETLVLNVDTETIQNAEGFDPNNWPDTTDPGFIGRTHDHYGFRPYWER